MEDTIRHYEKLFEEDGEIDSLEKELLSNFNSKIELIYAEVDRKNEQLSKGDEKENNKNAEKELQADEASSEDDIIKHSLIGTNSVVTFKVNGIDIIGSICLKDESKRIVDSIELKKGDIQTGSFLLGEGAPVGEYYVEITGTHYPIFRGRVLNERREKLSDARPAKKLNQEAISVLIDFPQENLESGWYPDKQDNPIGEKDSVSMNPHFGIQKINLRRKNSNEPVLSWDISPENFKGKVEVVLSEEEYPDDIYYYEVIGYNKYEKSESTEREKIDKLKFTLYWKTNAPDIPVKIELDFDPKWIYFIPKNGEEEAIQIIGENSSTTDVSFTTSDIVTKRLKPDEYKIKISGTGDEQKNTVFHAQNTFVKSNLYSRFDVQIKISDTNLTGERDLNQITSHLIKLADNWWKTAVHLINEKIENRFSNNSKPIQGLITMIDNSILGDLVEEFGSVPYLIAKACEGAIVSVVTQILEYANAQLQKGRPSLDEILNRVDLYVTRAQSSYTITGIDKDRKFHDKYLYEHRGLTTKKMLLQIEKDIDILIVGKSMHEFVNNIFK
jgi:hypothetical protein